MAKSGHNHKMQDIYSMIGITKQGFYKRLALEKRKESDREKIIGLAKEIRKDHRRMGCRKIYGELKPCVMGRDRVERLLLENGFRVPKKRSYHRTTYAGERFYKNLISGKEISDKNRLWVSDITYIPVGYKENYYLTLVLDVYTRRIAGWSLSATMTTEDTVKAAFGKAIAGLGEKERECLIFHSDKGTQYGSDLMKEELGHTKVNPSMGGKAWENAHAESLNGILKNEYINFDQSNIKLKEAEKLMEKWVYLYNFERPHGSLKNMKPMEFETYLEQLSDEDKPIMKINY